MRWTGSALWLFEVMAGVLLAASVTAPAGTAVGPAARVQADAGDREYGVQPGDSLWGVAGTELGDPYRWPEIAAASASIVQPGGLRLVDPDLIRPGWSLALPAGLAEMLIDPFKETLKAGIDITTEFPYKFANPSFPRVPLRSVPSDFGSPGPPPGLVSGYTRYAAAEDDEDRWELDEDGEYLERGQYAPLLSASVWAFDSKAHAREYVERLAPNILDQADQPVRAALPAAGNEAVLWRSGSGRHFKDLALVRQGNLVGEVVTRGFTTDGYSEAIEPLARALADQMAQVNPRARP